MAGSVKSLACFVRYHYRAFSGKGYCEHPGHWRNRIGALKSLITIQYGTGRVKYK